MNGTRRFTWPSTQRDFTGQDLSHNSFVEVDIDASQEPLSFHRADFRAATLARSRLTKVDLSRSDFQDALIEASALVGCNLDFFGMQSTIVSDSEIIDCAGQAAEFSESKFARTTFRGGSFVGGTFINCMFEECRLDGVGLERTTIENNHFFRSSLFDLDLGNQSVLHCTFSECTFERVIFDVDVLSTCTGFSTEDLAGVTITRRGRVLDEPLERIVNDLYERHVQRDELVEACTLAVLARRRDWFERAILELPHLLDAESVSFRTLQLVRFARKLLYWQSTDQVENFWIAWTCNTIIDRLRGLSSRLEPDHYVLETVTLLLPAVERYARLSVTKATAGLPAIDILATVPVRIISDDRWSKDEALALLEHLNEHAGRRLPQVLQLPGGIMRFEFARERRGSIILDGSMVLAGLMFLKVFLEQSRGVVRAARDLYDEWGRKPPGAPAPGGAHVGSAGGEDADDASAASQMDHGPLPSTGGIAIPKAREIQAAANRELIVSVATRLVVPPEARKALADHNVAVELRDDAEVKQ